MIGLNDEEKARKEEAQAGAGAVHGGLQQGAKAGVGSGEEVTEEMISAGLAVYRGWHPDYDLPSNLVREVFLAMSRHQPQ